VLHVNEITEALLGVNKLWFEVSVNFFAEKIDVNLHYIGAGIKIYIPYRFYDLMPGSHSSVETHEVFKQSIFFGG
jgi:hypothetical protein